MLQAFMLFAQAQEKQEAPWYNMLLPLAPIVVLLYFMLIMPARREKKQREELLGKLKKNDKVQTNAGIIGIVHFIDEKDDEIVLKLEEGRMKVLKSTIARVILPKDQAKETGIKEPG